MLAITGHDDRHYPDRVRGAGADYVLIKPCDGDQLVREARRLLAVLSSGGLADRSGGGVW